VEVREHYSLKRHNTFGLDVKARRYIRLESPDESEAAAEAARGMPILFLGEGSNILFLDDFDGAVIHLDADGPIRFEERGDDILLDIPGGKRWHDVVEETVRRGWSGIENLALIPGKAATAPVQNIGAYGREIADVLESCKAYDFQTGRFRTFRAEECRFGYRHSIFKEPEYRDRFLITFLRLRLRKNGTPLTDYGSLRRELERRGIVRPGPLDVFEAVSAIRRRKLPDPARIGNAGSFFKNPVVDADAYRSLSNRYPDMPAYPLPDGRYKIPAGWLIEKAGWKGYRRGDVGVHPRQALVLVNYGGATGREIYRLSQDIVRDVEDKFGIRLEREVRVIPPPPED